MVLSKLNCSIIMMSALIQGCKIPSNVSSIDFNSNCTHFASGGRESIKIFELRLQDKCWFDCKKTIAKYKGTSITKTCVSQLAWNKQGNDLIAIGTTSGYVLVFEASNTYKNIMQVKGHDGNINNIEWNTGSRTCFVSSSFENYILQWDIRQSEQHIAKYEYSETTKIRDLKFSPFNENYLAVQSSTKLEITDYRKANQVVCCYQIHDNELQGIGVQWDPNNPNRIASAISKEISIFDIVGQEFQLSNSLAHYSLIKSFYWMRTKENHFGVLGQHPQKNIFFYDLDDRNRISYMYGGHGRSIDCWKMDNDESILLSASNLREKSARGAASGSWGVLVAQYTDNYYDPNEQKYNYPLTFDNDHALAFCLTQDDSKKSFSSSNAFTRKKSNKFRQTSPLIYAFADTLEWNQREIKLGSLKEEFLYLYKNYMVEGKNEDIALNNSQIARRVGKHLAASVWKYLFQFAFPPEVEEHTIDSLYQEKVEVQAQIIENRLTLFNRAQLAKTPKKIDVLEVLQQLVDENQLQSAVIAAICLMNKSPSLIPDDFMHKIFTPYIQLLHNFDLYQVATDTIMMTRSKILTDITERNTTYNIACGWCKESISKGNCKCNKLCVICEGSLSQRMVIWCKYCGHGGHAIEYEKWFREDKKQLCPHGCGHACFTSDDF